MYIRLHHVLFLDHDGSCPETQKLCDKPIPVVNMLRYRCDCDSDCGQYSKCCKDICYEHLVCKSAVFDRDRRSGQTTTPKNVDNDRTGLRQDSESETGGERTKDDKARAQTAARKPDTKITSSEESALDMPSESRDYDYADFYFPGLIHLETTTVVSDKVISLDVEEKKVDANENDIREVKVDGKDRVYENPNDIIESQTDKAIFRDSDKFVKEDNEEEHYFPENERDGNYKVVDGVPSESESSLKENKDRIMFPDADKDEKSYDFDFFNTDDFHYSSNEDFEEELVPDKDVDGFYRGSYSDEKTSINENINFEETHSDGAHDDNTIDLAEYFDYFDNADFATDFESKQILTTEQNIVATIHQMRDDFATPSNDKTNLEDGGKQPLDKHVNNAYVPFDDEDLFSGSGEGSGISESPSQTHVPVQTSHHKPCIESDDEDLACSGSGDNRLSSTEGSGSGDGSANSETAESYVPATRPPVETVTRKPCFDTDDEDLACSGSGHEGLEGSASGDKPILHSDDEKIVSTTHKFPSDDEDLIQGSGHRPSSPTEDLEGSASGDEPAVWFPTDDGDILDGSGHRSSSPTVEIETSGSSDKPAIYLNEGNIISNKNKFPSDDEDLLAGSGHRSIHNYLEGSGSGDKPLMHEEKRMHTQNKILYFHDKDTESNTLLPIKAKHTGYIPSHMFITKQMEDDLSHRVEFSTEIPNQKKHIQKRETVLKDENRSWFFSDIFKNVFGWNSSAGDDSEKSKGLNSIEIENHKAPAEIELPEQKLVMDKVVDEIYNDAMKNCTDSDFEFVEHD